MKLRNLLTIPALALTLGYSGVASADKNTLEKSVTLKNGTLATFTMALDQSRCKLRLWLEMDGNLRMVDYPGERLAVFTDYNCDNTIDEIYLRNIIPSNKNFMLLRSIEDSGYDSIFNKSTKKYNRLLKKHNLRKDVEKDIGNRKRLIESELESELESLFETEELK